MAHPESKYSRGKVLFNSGVIDYKLIKTGTEHQDA